ncbi:MAG: type / secretion system protein DotU family [Edaphobacter sp.]|nr:type / secretion system protein DotU family [Edaphobacter sp.]
MSTTRTASLASTFQEPLTAILRVRFRRQQVQDAQTFRSQMRQSLQSSMQQARALGYTGEMIQIGVFAAVAFLDESVLNLQDPAFADWARRPLQEELFGGHLAGETFFHNLRKCLGQQDSMQVADVLELHCLCLLMGYRGRYALGDSGELFAMLRQARERIQRIRGGAHLLNLASAPPAIAPRPIDHWRRRLLITTCVLAGLAVLAFGGYEISLASGVSLIQSTSLNAH